MGVVPVVCGGRRAGQDVRIMGLTVGEGRGKARRTKRQGGRRINMQLRGRRLPPYPVRQPQREAVEHPAHASVHA